MNGQVWAMGKCERCNLTFYEFTIGGQGLKLFKLCGCSEGIQETNNCVKIYFHANKFQRKKVSLNANQQTKKAEP